MKIKTRTILTCTSALVFVITISQNTNANERIPSHIIDEFLASGGWSEHAEDTTSGEQLDVKFIRTLVETYSENPSNMMAVRSLGLLVLAEAVSGWGVKWNGEDYPEDPAKDHWKGPRSVASGKHLMSYAKGGVGIPHADSGFLKDLFDYLQENHPNLASEKTRFFKLKGVNFDVLYANGGHCNSPTTVVYTDLNGNEFGHERFGYAGEKYCSIYEPKASTNEKDWQIFRHWIREALRKRDVQEWIIERWVDKYWMPSFEKVVLENGGAVSEAFINARIRNSSSVTANCAIEYAKNASDPVAAQLEAYTLRECRGNERHGRRFGLMKRPVVLYETFTKAQ